MSESQPEVRSGGGVLLFARLVVFTPLAVMGLAVLALFIPVYGIVGLVVLRYLVFTWWIGGLLSLFVIFLALRDKGTPMVYGVGMGEALVLGLLSLQMLA
ncbi:hypothetical protein [Microbacterium sp. 179-I 3D4 NHS]|uniref:hypothetical protein n=1 Tax=Microbacterium sp. 179-I 3D4 NHS TaxID=3142381 RepID=UPI0039A22340